MNTICATCFHPLSEHVVSVDRCNHPAGPDARCTCLHYEEPTR